MRRKDVRDLVSSALKRDGYKQCAIAAKVGMTPQRLSDTLRKRRKLDANEFVSLCAAMNTTPDVVLGLKRE